MLINILNPEHRYNVIYADPPWAYRAKRKGKHGCADTHYPDMTPAQICSLPVERLAGDDCALFLWVTCPCLPQGLNTLAAWGFEYKTVAFSWVKRNKRNGRPFFGLGHWTRANIEVCLLGTKGKPKRVSASISSLIDTPIREHSQKPDEVRQKIVELMGDIPRIELFARGAEASTGGWDVWGLEAVEWI